MSPEPSEEERQRGFKRPVRRKYIHADKCGATTDLGPTVAETFARNPGFYEWGFCIACVRRYAIEEFTWPDGSRVGT